MALEWTLGCQVSELMPFQSGTEIPQGRIIPFCN